MLQLKLTNPCDMSWDAMALEAGRRTRRCASCETSVFDLASATEAEARAVVALFGGGGRLCARIQPDRDGDAVLRLDPRAARDGEAAARPARRLAMMAAATMAAACGGAKDEVQPCAFPMSKVVVAPPSAVSEGPSVEGEPRDGEARGHAGAARVTREEATGHEFGLVESAEGQPVGAQPAHPAPTPQHPQPTKRDPNDFDADGIPNAVDACPNEPGESSSDPRFNGCPMAMPGGIGVNDATRGAAQPKFAARAASVLPRDARVLDEIAALLREAPEVLRVDVRGHVARGEARPGARSVALASARAESVVAALVQRGVAPSRLRAVAAEGAHDPTEGAAAMGRVEFAIVERAPA